jgi:hypothetical protein
LVVVANVPNEKSRIRRLLFWPGIELNAVIVHQSSELIPSELLHLSKCSAGFSPNELLPCVYNTLPPGSVVFFWRPITVL